MLRKGDKVIIIAGKDRNKTGVIERVLPSRQRVVVSGVNIVKKTQKKSAQNPQGGIIDTNLPIHISNVMALDPKTNKPTRLGASVKGDRKQRIARVSGEELETAKK